jgi:saccharopine dehydrogenase (NAD+, L-lysine-forming)
MLNLASISSNPSLIVDITCDMGTPFNLLHLEHHATTLASPVQRIERKGAPLQVIAIDHLPNLLPKESSIWFSSQLLPLLLESDSHAWQAALTRFYQAIGEIS